MRLWLHWRAPHLAQLDDSCRKPDGLCRDAPIELAPSARKARKYVFANQRRQRQWRMHGAGLRQDEVQILEPCGQRCASIVITASCNSIGVLTHGGIREHLIDNEALHDREGKLVLLREYVCLTDRL